MQSNSVPMYACEVVHCRNLVQVPVEDVPCMCVCVCVVCFNSPTPLSENCKYVCALQRCRYTATPPLCWCVEYGHAIKQTPGLWLGIGCGHCLMVLGYPSTVMFVCLLNAFEISQEE